MEKESDRGIRTRKKTHVLPPEVIVEILLRLPVKSILRCKCVCKSWLLLISDPHFATLHFQLASARPHRHALVLIAPSTSQIRSLDFDASLHRDSASAFLNPSFLHSNSYHNLQIIGSCRGFLLLNSCQTLWLWNPSTGVHRKIPSSPIESNGNAMFLTLFYGFGYDPSKDDYLVVKASHNPFSRYIATCVQFFSLRDNAWRENEASHAASCLLSYYGSFRGGLFLNGAIHWLGFPSDESIFDVLAFDLTEWAFSEIPLSVDFVFEGDFEYCDLGLLGELLGLYCVVGCDHSVQVWVMKEYKVQSSWTKTIVVSLDYIPTGHFFLICSTKDGDIVGTDGRCGLAKCNDKGQLLDHRSYCNGLSICNGPCLSEVAVYTESLLSLP